MVSLNSIRAQLAAYKPSAGAQANLKAALEVYVNAEPQGSCEANIQGIRDDFPPQVLYSTEALRGPPVIYKHIRDYLLLQGFPYKQSSLSNRVAFGLPAMLYTSLDEMEIAMNCLSFLGAVGSVIYRDQSSASHSSAPSAPRQINTSPQFRNDATRVAHIVAVRFKSEDKFSGDLNQNIKSISRRTNKCVWIMN